MSIQLSTAIRNAMLDAIESTVGTLAIMRLRTGAAPANPAAADSGTIVATLNLPSDWMAGAASGAKAKLGTWEDTSADNAGTVAHFRIYDSAGTTCHLQGTVTITGGGGDLTLDNNVLAAGQDVIITSFSLNAGNAQHARDRVSPGRSVIAVDFEPDRGDIVKISFRYKSQPSPEYFPRSIER